MKFNLLLYLGLLCGSSIYAAPEDLFLQANDFTKANTALSDLMI